MKKLLLCTVDDVKELLAATASDFTQHDPILKSCMATASTLIQSYTGRKLERATHVDVFNLPTLRGGPFRLYTKALPIIGTPKAKFDPYRRFSEVDYLDASAFEMIDADRGVLGINIWNEAIAANALRVEYEAGFAAREVAGYDSALYTILDVPDDLQQACAIQAAFLANRFARNDTGKRGDEGSVVAKESVFSLAPDAAKLIAHYKMPRYRGV